MKRLTEQTIELAKDRIESLSDDGNFLGDTEAYESWQDTNRQLQAVAAAGTVEALADNNEAAKEIYDLLWSRDWYIVNPMVRRPLLNKDGYAIQDDLCRAGFFDKFSDTAVRNYRPRIRTVDGVKYEVGII